MENPFTKTEPKKDYKTVADYNKKRQLEMFRFSCFNSACVIVGNYVKDMYNPTTICIAVFDLAEILYNESIKRDYLNLEAKNETNRKI